MLQKLIFYFSLSDDSTKDMVKAYISKCIADKLITEEQYKTILEYLKNTAYGSLLRFEEQYPAEKDIPEESQPEVIPTEKEVPQEIIPAEPTPEVEPLPNNKFTEFIKRFDLHYQTIYKPFIYSLGVVCVEVITIYRYFWGNIVLAAVIHVPLVVMAYVDEAQLARNVVATCKKTLQVQRQKDSSFTLSTDYVQSVYKKQRKNINNVVRSLALVSLFVAFIQFLFYGYTYDENKLLVLKPDATLGDLLNNFQYIHTYKNLIQAVIIAMLQEFLVKVSNKVSMNNEIAELNKIP